MKKILVVGSLNMDMTIYVDHMPAIGETIIAQKVQKNPGGKGANQAYAVGKLGGCVSMMGAVGDDDDGALLLDNLRQVNVDTSHVIVKEEKATGKAIIYVDANGNNNIVVVQGTNVLLDVKDMEARKNKILESDYVLVQMEIPLPTIAYVVKTASEAGKIVILDPAPAMADFPKELYSYVDIIKPNETELGILLGDENAHDHPEEAAARLYNYGVKQVVVTLGEKGAYLYSDKYPGVRIPPRRVEAVDTTAAGDCFTAAMALKMAQGADIRDAVIFAGFVSSIVVTRKGAQSSIPSMTEVSLIQQEKCLQN